MRMIGGKSQPTIVLPLIFNRPRRFPILNDPHHVGRFYGHLWQVSAAIAAIFAAPAKPDAETDPLISEPTLQPDELAHRAVEHGDEHTIKVTEACLREDRIRSDPAYRAAAEAVLHRTPPLG